MITILDGNAFYLRITGKTKVGEYEATLDLEAIDSLIVNFVRRVRESQTVTHDQGKVLAYNDGKLAKGVYGVEMVGYYNGQPWRFYAPEVFEIADDGETEASNVIGSVNVYDVTFYMKLGGDGVTPGYVDAAVTMHNTSEEAHTDIREAITGLRTKVEDRITDVMVVGRDGSETSMSEYDDQGNKVVKLPQDSMGKVDGVSVNGEDLEVDENGKVDITIPTTVSDLEDADDYATKEYTDARTIGNVTATVGVGGETKQATVTKDGSDVHIEFPDLQGPKGDPLTWDDLTEPQKASLKGEPGDNCIPLEGESPLAQVLSQATDKAITPKAVYDATKFKSTLLDISEISAQAYLVYNGKWVAASGTSANRRIKLIPVTAGNRYWVENINGIRANYTVLTTDTITVGATPSYATAWTWSAGDQSMFVDIPSNGAFLCLQVHTNDVDVPWAVSHVDGSAFANETGNDEYKAMSQEGVTVALEKSKLLQSYENVTSIRLSSVDAQAYSAWEVDGVWKWMPSSYNDSVKFRRMKLIPVDKGKYILVNRGTYGNDGLQYAILSSNTISDWSNLVFASGTVAILPHRQSIEIDVPSDNCYLYAMVHSSNNDVDCKLYEVSGIALKEKAGYDEHTPISQKAMTEALSSISVDLATLEETSAALGKTNWLNVSDRRSVFLPVHPGECIRITGGEVNTTFAVLTSNSYDRSSLLPFAKGWAYRKGVTPMMSVREIMPDDAKYLCITTYISGDRTPNVEIINNDEWAAKTALANSLLQGSKVISDADYTYAFLPQILEDGYHLKTIFAGNKTTYDGDATDNTNKMVLADYDIMTGQVDNTEMPDITSFVDSNGDTISGVTKAYNNCIFGKLGNDIAMCGLMGNATSGGYSIGYKTTFEGTTYTRCHLAYNDGEEKEVEFTSDNYRQMLYDMGFTDSVVESESFTANFTSYYYYNSKHYIVTNFYSLRGEGTNLPLVLLESDDFATWSVVNMLGESLWPAGEIRFVIKDDTVYLVSRNQVDTWNAGDTTTGGAQSSESNRYMFGIYQMDGTALMELTRNHFIMSLPMCFEVNGRIWFGVNEVPSLNGNPDKRAYPNARQQMAFYLVNDDYTIEEMFRVENPTGFNYPTSVTIPTYTKTASDNNRERVENLDRVYVAFSEDRRGVCYRQINNVSLVNLTPIF